MDTNAWWESFCRQPCFLTGLIRLHHRRLFWGFEQSLISDVWHRFWLSCQGQTALLLSAWKGKERVVEVTLSVIRTPWSICWADSIILGFLMFCSWTLLFAWRKTFASLCNDDNHYKMLLRIWPKNLTSGRKRALKLSRVQHTCSQSSSIHGAFACWLLFSTDFLCFSPFNSS